MDLERHGPRGCLVVDLEAGDARMARPGPAPREERVDIGAGALGPELYAAVGEVARPPRDALRARLLGGRLPVPDALHAP